MPSHVKAFTSVRSPAKAHSRCAAARAEASTRRALLLSAGCATALAAPTAADAISFPFFGDRPDDIPLPKDTIRDKTLAYQFTYPTVTASGRRLPVDYARRPEKYSSAAPLTADARQRIVTELVSLADGVTYSVFVGPVPSWLTSKPQEQWKSSQVATAVLTDRSPSRNSAGQRIPLASVETSSLVKRDDARYYVYETVQQGSPNLYDPSRDTYRQGLCITATRPALSGDPYFYTLSLSCPSTLWPELEEGFRKAIDSFTLLTPTRDYVPPDKDPWLFF